MRAAAHGGRLAETFRPRQYFGKLTATATLHRSRKGTAHGALIARRGAWPCHPLRLVQLRCLRAKPSRSSARAHGAWGKTATGEPKKSLCFAWGSTLA